MVESAALRPRVARRAEGRGERGRTIAHHNHHLTIATMAAEAPMGAQSYQEEIASRAQHALSHVSDDSWKVSRVIARSLRSELPGNRRIPLRAVTDASASARRALGRLLYPAGVTHRMNLELPPGRIDVVTLHDVVAWRFADESPVVREAREELRRADAVICVSEFTASEAADLLGLKRVAVVHNGVHRRFFDAAPLDDAARTRLGIGPRYVLHAGGATRRKNLDALAAAWPRVHRERPGLQLVLSGPPHPRRTELFGGMPGTALVGRVPDELVPGLVAASVTVVVPSLYEGFGLPVLEAMAAGVPVVAADTSSLPEVAGGSALLVEPTADGIAEGLLASTADDAGAEVAARVRAGRERAAQFTWDASAAGHARVWESVG